MLNQLIRKDVLTGKRSIAPLGCVVLSIGALFIGACILGWYVLLTSNVTRLSEPAQAVATETALPAPTLAPTAVVVATAIPKPSPVITSVARVTATMTAMASAKTTPTKTVASAAKPSATINATQGITWSVRSVTVAGQTFYDGPPEIKAWIVRDFLAALQFHTDHLFEKDYLLANLSQYYTGKYAAQWKKSIPESFSANRITGPLLAMRRAAPYDQPQVTAFSANGRQAMVNINTVAGEWKRYDPRTRKPLPGFQSENTTWVYQVEFSAPDKRWKIERILMTFDTDTLGILAQDDDL